MTHPPLRDDDVAAMDTITSTLALHDGRNDDALSAIEQAIDHWKHAHGPGYFMLGTVLKQKGDLAPAEEALRTAIRLTPEPIRPPSAPSCALLSAGNAA